MEGSQGGGRRKHLFLDERSQLVMLYGLVLQLMGEGRIMLKGALYMSVREWRVWPVLFISLTQSRNTSSCVHSNNPPLPSPPLPPYRKVSQVRQLHVAEAN